MLTQGYLHVLYYWIGCGAYQYSSRDDHFKSNSIPQVGVTDFFVFFSSFFLSKILYSRSWIKCGKKQDKIDVLQVKEKKKENLQVLYEGSDLVQPAVFKFIFFL